MYKIISVFTLYLITIANFSCDVESASSESSCPFIPTKPLPYSTLSPIDVDTKTAKWANTTSPLTLRNAVFSFILVKNTGYALELYGNPEVFTTTGLYGGVLCNSFYIFHKLRFFVNSNLKGRSNDLVDGVGTCLTLSFIYYNSKYPSFNESLNHRDGVAILNVQLTTGPVTNLLFIPVGLLIRLLREPGSQLYLAPVALAYAWFDDLPIVSKYYAYPGSYFDIETGKHYECAMVMVVAGQYPQLTALQYQAFLSLKSINGSSLETVSPKVYPAGKRPVYKALGVQGRFVLV